MWIRPIEETPICTFTIVIITNEVKMLCKDQTAASNWTDPWTGIQYNTIWGLVYLPYNFTSYFEGGSVGLGTGLGKTYLGDQSSYSEFEKYTAIATRRDKEYLLTLLDMANMTNRMIWQYKAENTIKNVNFFQNGSRILASSGNTLYIFQNPLVETSKPTAPAPAAPTPTTQPPTTTPAPTTTAPPTTTPAPILAATQPPSTQAPVETPAPSKGICGPTAIALIALLPVALRLRKIN